MKTLEVAETGIFAVARRTEFSPHSNVKRAHLQDMDATYISILTKWIQDRAAFQRGIVSCGRTIRIFFSACGAVAQRVRITPAVARDLRGDFRP